jgi:uncharacterized protein (TIGR00299 family) protein
MTRIGWVDCSSGVSGDMLLGAIDDLGALTDLPATLASMPDLGATVNHATVQRSGLSARQVEVRGPTDPPGRRLTEVLALVADADLTDAVRQRVTEVFGRLARAESAVHGVEPDEVHFHEVGAVDSVVDVIGVCLGLDALGIDHLVVGPIALGGGSVRTAHGELPVPGPAVLRLVEASSLVVHGGPVDVELATPTGVALLAEYADRSAPMPPMHVTGVGVGAGSRDLPGRPNTLRLVIGTLAGDGGGGEDESWLLTEANVDDLDPRLWPTVLEALLAAGAADAWLSPILMKKGRPAYTVSVLTEIGRQSAVLDTLFRESTTIGARTTRVAKHGLDRSCTEVHVDGESVRVKVAMLDGEPVTVTPEWEDVAAAARRLGRPAKTVLAQAIAASRGRPTPDPGGPCP